jgi:hypothetical protein
MRNLVVDYVHVLDDDMSEQHGHGWPSRLRAGEVGARQLG